MVMMMLMLVLLLMYQGRKLLVLCTTSCKDVLCEMQMLVLLLMYQGRKLLVLCTTSCKDVLREMQMLSVFTKIVHVSNISRPEHLLACLDHLNAFTPREMDQVRRWASSGKR